MKTCIFNTFPYGIQGQVWCLVMSYSDICCLSYFQVLLGYEDYKNYLYARDIFTIYILQTRCPGCQVVVPTKQGYTGRRRRMIDLNAETPDQSIGYFFNYGLCE